MRRKRAMGSLLPLILLGIPYATGYTYFVRNNGEAEGLCMTDEVETAVAVLPQRDGQWEATNQDQRDCVLTNGAICPGWTHEGFTVKDNFDISDQYGGHDIFQPITDERWHSFPVISSNGNFQYLFEIGVQKANILFHTSVRCAGDVKFLFAKDKALSGDGYVVTLHRGALNERNKIEFEICDGRWKIRCYSLYNQDILIHMHNNLWYTLTLKIDNRKSHVFYLIVNDAQNIQLDPKNYESFYNYNHVHVQCSQPIGLFKLHAYNFLKSTSNEYNSLNYVERSFEVKHVEPFCVEVIYSGGSASNAEIVVTNSAKNMDPLNFQLYPREINTWKKKRFEGVLQSGTYKISVKAQGSLFYIGGIHFCQKGMPWISSNRGVQCQILKSNNLILASSAVIIPRNEIASNVVTEICSRLRLNDCKKLVACAATGCFCLSGHTRSQQNYMLTCPLEIPALQLEVIRRDDTLLVVSVQKSYQDLIVNGGFTQYFQQAVVQSWQNSRWIDETTFTADNIGFSHVVDRLTANAEYTFRVVVYEKPAYNGISNMRTGDMQVLRTECQRIRDEDIKLKPSTDSKFIEIHNTNLYLGSCQVRGYSIQGVSPVNQSYSYGWQIPVAYLPRGIEKQVTVYDSRNTPVSVQYFIPRTQEDLLRLNHQATVSWKYARVVKVEVDTSIGNLQPQAFASNAESFTIFVRKQLKSGYNAWSAWQMKDNFSDSRGELVTKTISGLDENTQYQLKVVVKEQNEPASFENTQMTNFTTCKLTSSDSNGQVYLSGNSICIPWEVSNNECQLHSCTVNSEKSLLSLRASSICCALNKIPDRATTYSIVILGERWETRAKLNYTSPKTYKINYLVFTKAPTVQQIEPYQVLVSVNKKNISPREYKQNFKAVEIQYLKHYKSWATLGQQTLLTTSEADAIVVLVTGLSEATNYAIRAIIIENDDGYSTSNNLRNTLFQTTPCKKEESKNFERVVYEAGFLVYRRKENDSKYCQLHQCTFESEGSTRNTIITSTIQDIKIPFQEPRKKTNFRITCTGNDNSKKVELQYQSSRTEEINHLAFDDGEPNITAVHAYTVQFSANQSLTHIKSSNDSKYFEEARIQIKKKDEFKWVLNKSLNLDAQVIEVNGLEPSTSYYFEAFVIETTRTEPPKGRIRNGTFRTIKCNGNTNETIRFGQNYVISQVESDSNLCRISKFIIKLENGTKISPELQFGDDHSDLITGLLNNHKSLNFAFEDAQGVILLTKYAPEVTDNNTGLMVGLVFLVLLTAISVIAFYLIKRQKTSSEKFIVIGDGDENSVAMSALSRVQNEYINMNEADYEAPIESDFSKLVQVSDYERYLSEAVKFGLIKDQYFKFPKGQTQPWDEGKRVINKSKNRYGNLAAYDHSRVRLQRGLNDGGSDYINANYIHGPLGENAYIATQGPSPATVDDFWKMIWAEKVNLIIMVTSIVENGKVKCEKYWPNLNEDCEFKSIKITCNSEQVFSDYTRRTFEVKHANCSTQLTQMHYTTWPDHGVPKYPQSMVNFAKQVFEIESTAPIVVHCSAGVGRTGTYILIDSGLRSAKKDGHVNLMAMLAHMRTQRPNMIDNEVQYTFSHLVLLEALVIPQFSTQCNEFHSYYRSLQAQQGLMLTKQFEEVNKVCKGDWERLRDETKISAKICRFPTLLSVTAGSRIVRLFPDVVTKDQTVDTSGVYVDGFQQANQFIAVQAPLKGAAAHFWCMVKQNQVEKIIILNDAMPDEEAFEPNEGETMMFPGLTITLEQKNVIGNFHISVCTLTSQGCVAQSVEVLRVSGLLPARPIEFSQNQQVEAALLQLCKDLVATKAPIVLVCYDGVTSCGLFIALGFIIEKIKWEQQVDVALAVRCLRKVRPTFISTLAQYNMLHNAAVAYLDEFETYGNFQ